MYCQVTSAAICGLQANKVTVEADFHSGMPMFAMVGFLSSEVREAQDRVRTALKNNGIELPLGRITVNLAPADLRKEGSGFDLAIAMALLGATGILDAESLGGILFAGELGLNGQIEPVRGIIEMTARAVDFGCDTCIIPAGNLREGSVMKKGEVFGAGTIREVIDFFKDGTLLETDEPDIEKMRLEQLREESVDFAQIRGQETLKRAAEVAVAGGHNLLIMGPPGAGKTMTAQCIPTILPRITPSEAMEITRIHSIAGTLPGDVGLMMTRPFRILHHTITPAGLAGGGRNPRPGEISLAHRGVLFMDELPEFKPETLEILRQPMEDKQITISRNFGNYRFPADFQLVASANPCKCGYYPDRKKCRCSAYEIRQYLSRISGPLLDRIDMCVEAKEMSFEEITEPVEQETTSEKMRERVEKARQIQKERFAGGTCLTNAAMGPSMIETYCNLGPAEKKLMEKIYRKMDLTVRGYFKLLKVARTVADLAGEERITCDHLAEAVSYKMIDQKYWGNL